MCLVAVIHRAGNLLVAANRDERLDRPATAWTVLRESGPRILGGRDHEAGGTWLAVNEHGVVATLTNVPGDASAGRRSRGELPLILAESRTAAEGVARLRRTRTPAEYRPAWLLCGDRESLWYLDWTRTADPVRLPPGIHVLENAPIEVATPKSRAVRAALEAGVDPFAILASHVVPPGEGALRPRETLANCVHFGIYGTRGATVVRCADGLPEIRYTDGPPCTSAIRRGTWESAGPG